MSTYTALFPSKRIIPKSKRDWAASSRHMYLLQLSIPDKQDNDWCGFMRVVTAVHEQFRKRGVEEAVATVPNTSIRYI